MILVGNGGSISCIHVNMPKLDKIMIKIYGKNCLTIWVMDNQNGFY